MGFPASYAAEVVDYVTGRAVATTAAADTYLMCLTGNPGRGATLADAAALEDTTPGYARQKITWGAPVIPTDDGPVLASNAADITFGPYTAAQALGITHIALTTSAAGTVGALRWIWTLAEVNQAAINDFFLIPTGVVQYGAQAESSAA